MAYQEFLKEFASVQGLDSVDTLLTQEAERYSFQINSRQRSQQIIKELVEASKLDFNGKAVLDVGCAYGSFTIELAKLGARAIGIDISDKWLKLAAINARDEVDAKFVRCDASSRRAVSILKEHAPFDIFIINDVFEHIFDTAGLLSTIDKLSAPDAQIYFKIPNGHATRHVLAEGHKKIFGISLLAPDYWHLFTKAPFHIYYRRWQHFDAIFSKYGFSDIRWLAPVTDRDLATTRQHILSDANKIRRSLKAENFNSAQQFKFVRDALLYYNEELADDVESLEWDVLYRKYREAFWQGIARRN